MGHTERQGAPSLTLERREFVELIVIRTTVKMVVNMAESVFIAKTVVDLASPLVKDLLAEAGAKNKTQTERCVGYLRAAQTVIKALHQEFEEIVAQAELCDVNDPHRLESLRTRLHKYLYLNILRPDLWTAIEGMHEQRTLLQQRVDSVLNLPSTQEKRQEVMAYFVNNIEELEGFAAQLGYDYPSGIGLEMLMELYNRVNQLIENAQAALNRTRSEANALRALVSDRKLVALLDERRRLTTRIEISINRLLATF